MGETDPGRAGNHRFDGEPTVIKKYANRRLYDTGRSAYVTLADLAAMTRAGHNFVVRDARTDEDITAAIFVQIVLESESRGEHLLPIGFLRRLVSLYGDALQHLVPGYLESSMEIFTRNQERLRQQMEATLANPAAAGLEQMQEVNRALFEPALSMLAPYAARGDTRTPPAGERAEAPPAPPAPPAPEGSEAQIRELRAQVEELRQRVARLAGEP